MSCNIKLSRVKYSALCLTHDCNLRCRYCYAGKKHANSMSYETARRAIDFLYEESGGKCCVTFFGGEPLLEFDLIQNIVEYSNVTYGHAIAFRMSTNGTLLSPEILDFLDRNEIFFVLSIDGCSEQHDLMRITAAGGGSYDLVAQHIDRILEINPYTIAVSVISPQTAKYLAEGVIALFDSGFRYVLQTLDYSAGWNKEHMKVLEKQYRELSRFYFKSLETGRKVYYSPFDERIKTHAQKPYGRGDLCDLANTQIAIAPSGRIYPCVQFVGVDDEKHQAHAIGDVFEGFDRELRITCVALNYSQKDACAGCAHEGRCAVNCGCVNWRATGSIDRFPPVICEHERMLMPIVDRLANRLWRKKIPLFRSKFYDTTFPVSSYIEDCMIRRGEEDAED